VNGGRLDEAVVELQLASELNPCQHRHRRGAAQRPRATANKVAVAREGKTQLESLIERSRDLSPPGLELAR
jgi:hypothetical protein